MDLCTSSSRSRIGTRRPSRSLPVLGAFSNSPSRALARLGRLTLPRSPLCSLFQIVVDNDETATKILDVMIKEKSGRITFMPLNRLKPQNVEYPNAKEAIAM